jgi:uncharacterized protein
MAAKESAGTSSARVVNCPTCGKPVLWTRESRYRPFCSERCKMIDLGAWAAETYRVPVADNEADEAPDDDGDRRG